MLDFKKLLVGSLLLGLLSSAQAQTIYPKQGISAHIQFRTFYKSRDVSRLPALLKDMDRSTKGDWTAHPPIIGFLAGLLAANPNRTDLLPINASQILRSDLAVAYSLSGQPERGLALAQEIGLDEKSQAFIRSSRPLHNLTVRSPTELDYLWGAAFATGNPAYIKPIVRRFVQLMDQPQKASDVLAMTEFMHTRKGDIRAIKDRYERSALLDLALASAILAALSKNAAEHEFIRNVVGQDLPRDSHAFRAFAAFAGQAS
jgi:hypothetical protein